MLRTNFLTELIGAEANLANVTDTSFILSLTSNETRSVAVTLDYGDIKTAAGDGAGSRIRLLTPPILGPRRSVGAPVFALYQYQFSVERLLADHPALLTFATTNDLATAKAALLAGVNRYFEASQFIRSRATNVVRLFNYDLDKATDEANFRQTLADLTNSLTHAVTLACVFELHGVPWLAVHRHASAPALPAGDSRQRLRVGHTSRPDLWWAGLQYHPGIVEDSVEEFLAKGLSPIPTIAPGLTKAGLQFQFPINTLKNRGYTVEVSTNLRDWTNSYAFFSFTDGYAFADTNAYASHARFYRIVDRTETCRRRRMITSPTGFLLPAWALRPMGINASATTEPGEPGYPWISVWWSWTAPVSGSVVVEPLAARLGRTRRFIRAQF